MPWFNREKAPATNCVVVGDTFSGHGEICQALNQHPKVICHGDLIGPDESVRQEAHESYFGTSRGFQDWFRGKEISAEQYLSNKVFDNNLHAEKVVGLRLDYSAIIRYDLWEYLERQSRGGDFCLIHVWRNPIASYLARQSKPTAGPGKLTSMLDTDTTAEMVNKLVSFVSDMLALQSKVRNLTYDYAEVPYHEFVLDSDTTTRRMLQYLGLDYEGAIPRLKLRPFFEILKDRLTHEDKIREAMPMDMRKFLDEEPIF